MAVSDIALVAKTSIAAGAYLTIQPSIDTEWAVTHIVYTGAVEFYISDSSGDDKFDSDASLGFRAFSPAYPVSNTDYLKVKNVTAGTIKVLAKGWITK